MRNLTEKEIATLASQGCIAEDWSKIQVADEFSTLVNPECSIPFYASQVNGITDDMVKDAPSDGEALKLFFDFVGERMLVAHNASFDTGFIRQAAQRKRSPRSSRPSQSAQRRG